METLTTTTIETIRHNDFAGIADTKETSYVISTLGTLCDIEKPAQPSLGDVVTRDAFYKIRFAIAATQPVHYTSINPDSKLESLFPRKGRKQNIRAFQKALGIDVDLLAVKDSLEWAIILSALVSFITLFYTWKGAAACFAFTAVIGWLSRRFGTELKLDSVGQLTAIITREHYIKASCDPDYMLVDAGI